MLFLVERCPKRNIAFCRRLFVNRLLHNILAGRSKDESTFFCLCTRFKDENLVFLLPFLSAIAEISEVISNIMRGIWGLTNRDLLRVDKFLLYDITKKGSQWVRARHKLLRIQSDDTIKDSEIEFRKLIASTTLYASRNNTELNKSLIWSKKFSSWITYL
jgi:hypothetical protein